jgi:hypothetical protein
MRKMILMLGTVLIATILISGSAVAVTYWIFDIDDSGDCTNITNIIGSDDGNDATIGVSGSPDKLGWAVLDLGEFNPMPPSKDFTVYGSSLGGNVEEDYSINVSEDPDDTDGVGLGNGDDNGNEVFTTPSTQGSSWRYIIIRGLSGDDDTAPIDDPVYGPEIDAIGWVWP